MTCFMHGRCVSKVGEFHFNKLQRVGKGERHTGKGHRWGEERRGMGCGEEDSE